jgi:hypothetical protein
MAINAKKQATPAPTEADARTATSGDLVEVTLTKDRKWVPEGSNKAVVYPAGRQSIPLAMAQGLGLVEGGPTSKETPTPDGPQGEAPNSAAVSDLYAIVDTLYSRVQALEAFVEGLGADSSKANPADKPADTAKKDGK